MEKLLRKLVEDKRLHQKISDKIARLGVEDQKSILDFIEEFRLGINYSKEFIGYLLDISRRDAASVPQILNDPALINLGNNQNLPRARKMELLREELRRRRFPIFYGQ